MSDAKLSQRITGHLNALLMPRALDLINFRIRYYDRTVDPARSEYNEHVIFSFWHEYIVVILPRWGHTPLTVLCSQHRDGELVNQTAESLGLNIVRGSTSRGGASAIRAMKSKSKFSSIAMTPDGPRGPRREMAMGPVYLASLLGLPLVPVGIGISNPYRLSTWDKFAIPRPLSRVRVIFGPKIRVPRKVDKKTLAVFRTGAQRLMDALTDEAQCWADSKQKMVGEKRFTRDRRASRVVFEQPVVTSPKLKIVKTLPPQTGLGVHRPDKRVG